MKNIHILGGGTFSYVRSHMALAAPAFGNTARDIAGMMYRSDDFNLYDIHLTLTKMADYRSDIVTNQDVENIRVTTASYTSTALFSMMPRIRFKLSSSGGMNADHTNVVLQLRVI